MGTISPQVYKTQQEQIQAMANEQLAAQYRAMGKEPPEFTKGDFIEGEFEEVREQINARCAFFGMGDPVLDRILGLDKPKDGE